MHRLAGRFGVTRRLPASRRAADIGGVGIDTLLRQVLGGIPDRMFLVLP
jgi:hypothetical protein